MVREYIGARYVPKFMGTYDETQQYEALSVVDNGMGTSYISKIPTPAGTPLSDTVHWAIYGATSGALINLQNQIDKINSDRKSLFVIPQDFGAVGDGTADDYQAFQDTIDYAVTNNLAVLIPAGRYKIGTQLEISGSVAIEGIGDGVSVVLEAYAGISVKASNVKIAHIWLRGDDTQSIGSKTGNGISIDASSNGFVFDDVLFAHYSNCFTHSAYFFGADFVNCRFYASDYAMKFVEQGVGYKVYDVHLTDCWFLTTDKLFNFIHCGVTFNSCIIDINSAHCIESGSTSEVAFNDCTFEMATNIASGDPYIWYANGHIVINHCIMVENTTSSYYWFVVTANTLLLSIINTVISAYNSGTRAGGFINNTFSGSSNYGVIEIMGCRKYDDRIFDVTDAPAFMPRYNVIDGIGIKVRQTYYDTSKLVTGHKYTVFDAGNNFISEAYWDGTQFVQASNPIT